MPPNPGDEKIKTLRSVLVQMDKEIAAALPAHVTKERFLRIMLTTLRRSPKLLDCSITSILGAMMRAAQDGLELDGTHAALVPFRNQGRMEAQYLTMFRGMIALARRSGEVSVVRARPVYEGDIFEYEDGLTPKLRHVRGDQDEEDEAIKWFYCVVDMKDGSQHFEVMTRKAVEKIRNGSKGYQFDPKGSPWATHFPEMGCKTVARRTLKWCPMSAEVQRSLDHDEQLVHHGPPAMLAGSDVSLLAEGSAAEPMPAEVTGQGKGKRMAEEIRARTATMGADDAEPPSAEVPVASGTDEPPKRQRRVRTVVSKPRPGGPVGLLEPKEDQDGDQDEVPPPTEPPDGIQGSLLP